MTTHFVFNLLALTALKSVDSARLQRAVLALTENSLAITLTRQSTCEIRALVKNWRGERVRGDDCGRTHYLFV